MVNKSGRNRRRLVSSIAEAYRTSHEVMSAALSIALLAGGGYWLDVKYGWKPVLTIVGMVIGCSLAAASLRQLLIRLDKQSKKNQPERQPTIQQQKGFPKSDGPEQK